MNHNINLLASETALLIFRCLVLELWNQIIQKIDTKKKSFHLWVLIWWVFFSCSFFFHLLLLPVSGLFFFFCEQFVFVEVKHERLPKFHCNLHFFYNYCWCEVASWLFFFFFFVNLHICLRQVAKEVCCVLSWFQCHIRVACSFCCMRK